MNPQGKISKFPLHADFYSLMCILLPGLLKEGLYVVGLDVFKYSPHRFGIKSASHLERIPFSKMYLGSSGLPISVISRHICSLLSLLSFCTTFASSALGQRQEDQKPAKDVDFACKQGTRSPNEHTMFLQKHITFWLTLIKFMRKHFPDLGRVR